MKRLRFGLGPTCPTSATLEQTELGLVGCGSTNVLGPDTEGLYDCLDCGLWFRWPEEAQEKGKERRRHP